MQNNPLPFVCRRCLTQPSFRTYEHLRGHLRAIHSIRQLSNDDLPLYETFPGSRSLSPSQGTSSNRNVSSSQQSTSSAGSPVSRPAGHTSTADVAHIVQNYMISMEERNTHFQESLKTSISLAISGAIQNFVHDLFRRNQSMASTSSSTPRAPIQRDVFTETDRENTAGNKSDTAKIKPEPTEDKPITDVIPVGNSSSDDELLAMNTPELSEMVPVAQIIEELARSVAENSNTSEEIVNNPTLHVFVCIYDCENSFTQSFLIFTV